MKVGLIFIIFTILKLISAHIDLPVPTIEALKSGKVRISIPHINGTKLIAFHANLNEPIEKNDAGTYFNETRKRDGNYWILTFDIPLEVDNIIYYWMYFAINRFPYVSEGQWIVKELKDSFGPLGQDQCQQSATIINGKRTSCIGSVIFEDNFTNAKIDKTKWMVHHKIPTYSGPNYEFNSYLDHDETRFIKDNKLFLKPIPILEANDVRGVLNLTDKCTSQKLHECIYSQKSSFILPPVKSAKLTSNLTFQYGKIEVKAKLPSGDWIVPIIELEDKSQTDGDNSAKVWIAYSRGNKILKGNGPDDYGSRLLFGGPVVFPAEPTRSKHLASKYASKPFSDDYHIYTMEWKPGQMRFYIDGELYGDISTAKGFAEYSLDMRADWTIPEAPYNKEYALSLGVSVGGIYDFPDGFKSDKDPKPWTNTERNYIFNFFEARDVWRRTWRGDDVALQMDYVKITAI